MDRGAGGGDEVGDVFVAVVEVVGEDAGRREKDEGAGGDGFGGIPNVGLVKSVGGGAELLDAEVIVVDEALEGFLTILRCAHFDAAAHAVEGHRDGSVARLPTDGAVFGVVDN